MLRTLPSHSAEAAATAAAEEGDFTGEAVAAGSMVAEWAAVGTSAAGLGVTAAVILAGTAGAMAGVTLVAATAAAADMRPDTEAAVTEAWAAAMVARTADGVMVARRPEASADSGASLRRGAVLVAIRAEARLRAAGTAQDLRAAILA